MKFSDLKHLTAVMVALPSLARAQFPSALVINNLCPVEAYAFIASTTSGNCDYGPSLSCTQPSPYLIAPSTLLTIPWIPNSGTSIKLFKSLNSSTSSWVEAFNNGIFQFEYTYNFDEEGNNEGIYWDPSDLDGAGSGRVGTPWEHDNVAIVPAGMGIGEGSCWGVFCRKDVVCVGAYQTPNDVDTKFCGNVDAIFITLCAEDGVYSLY